MMDPITGGGLHHLRHLGQSFYHDAKKNDENTAMPLAILGAVTVGIGCKMMFEAWKQTKAGHQSFPDRGRRR